MPYSLPDNIPDYIKNLPVGAQRIFVDVYNETEAKGGSEDEARQAGWGAVKNVYEKHGDEWVRKAKEADTMDELAELSDAYALHNQLHLEYANIQLGRRRKSEIQRKHADVVTTICNNGGVHISKDDDLDKILPQELRGVLVARYVTPIVDDIRLLEDYTPHEDRPLTSRIQVLRTGTFYHPIYGKFSIADTDLQNMVSNFMTFKRPKLPTEMVVDYEHMSAPGQSPQPAPAAGWVKAIEKLGAKLYCIVEWTVAAADKIRNKEYRFISPEFTLNYRDKETNKLVGPTLLALALTNRPFVEGMQPVALSDEVAKVAAYALSEKVMQRMISLAAGDAMALADWDTQYINDLPDSAFAYIKPGGEKDEAGKTVPRSLRFLPYKNKAGEVDLPHLRNALARLPQTDLSPEEKGKAAVVLNKAAKAAGVGEEEKTTKEVLALDEAIIRELLGIGPEGSIEAAIQALLDKLKILEALPEPGEPAAPTAPPAAPAPTVTAGEAEIRQLLGIAEGASIEEAIRALLTKVAAAATTVQEEAETEVQTLVEKAITDRKLLPKQRETAKALCLKDKTGFIALMELAPVIGPDAGELGSATNNLEVTITTTEKSIATRMGVSDEQLQKVKKEQAAKTPSAASA